MDDKKPFVLLIRKDAAGGVTSPESGEGSFKLQCVESMPTALARIGGGGVDVIMLDLSLRDDRSSDALANFLKVRQAAPQAPIIVLHDASDEGLALRAMRAGAVDFLPRQECGDRISIVIRSATEQARKQLASRNTSAVASRRNGETISFIGGKGGVGVTTVALNVASVLARRGKVILVEMRPAFGSLAPYFKPYGQVRTISHLLRSEATEISPADASACLWPCKKVPGLSVLFGPQTATECGELTPSRVTKLIQALAGLADYVVLDLPASLSAANRVAIEASGRLVLVVERDPICVQSAKLLARAMEAWDGTPQPIEIILVNRASPGCPMPLAEIETQLGSPPLGVVPPEPDLCLSAEQAHTPLVVLEPDCLVAGSLVALAEKCVSFMRIVPMVA